MLKKIWEIRVFEQLANKNTKRRKAIFLIFCLRFA